MSVDLSKFCRDDYSCHADLCPIAGFDLVYQRGVGSLALIVGKERLVEGIFEVEIDEVVETDATTAVPRRSNIHYSRAVGRDPQSKKSRPW